MMRAVAARLFKAPKALSPEAPLGLPETISDAENATIAPGESAQNKAIGAALDLFERDVTRIVADLSNDILSARDESKEACSRLHQVRGSMETLVESSQQVEEEITGIAHSSDTLAVAAREISQTVVAVQQRASATLHSADASTLEIEGLGVGCRRDRPAAQRH